jgi:uncharacterized protein
MAKIDDFSHITYHPESFLRKSDLDKSDKTKKKSSINFEKKSAFQEVFSSEMEDSAIENVETTEIERLLKDIGIQGELLKKSKNLEDLDNYKKMVKKFILNIVELSETTEKKVVWNRFKKEKIAKIHLQIIDKELLDLTRIFMSEQYSVLQIASKIDKIQGMLIDLAS